MTERTPRQVLDAWLDRFNGGDIAGLADLYADDAVNHQVANAPAVGRAAIVEMFTRELGGQTLVCIPEAIHEAGEVVALEWRDPKGMRGCGFFTVRDGLIQFQRGYWDKLSFLRLYGLPLDLAEAGVDLARG